MPPPDPRFRGVRELARGQTQDPALRALAAPFNKTRVAVLRIGSSSGVRLTVVDSDHLQEQELEVLTPQELPPATENGAPVMWSLAWSVDGAFLVLTGAVGATRDAHLWVATCSAWMTAEPTDEQDEEDAGLILVPVSPSECLPSAQWKTLRTPSIVSLFCTPYAPNRVVWLTSDGLVVAMDIQRAKLTLLALQDTNDVDVAAVFQMSVLTRVTKWHAGVTTGSFAPSQSRLVLSGGVRNPSEELVQQRASSLSVWQLNGNGPLGELLESTMVMGTPKEDQNGDMDRSEDSALAAEQEAPPSLFQAVANALWTPVRFLLGTGAADSSTSGFTLAGSIGTLALSPDGRFVSMLDDKGQLAIREIESCAMVLDWQLIQVPGSLGEAVKSVTWMGTDIVAIVLQSTRTASEVVYASLSRPEDDDDSGMKLDILETPPRYVAMNETGSSEVDAVPVADIGKWRLAALYPVRPTPSDSSAEASFCQVLCSSTINGTAWTVQMVYPLELTSVVKLMMDTKQWTEALLVVESHGDQFDDAATLAKDIHRELWLEFRAKHFVELVMDKYVVLDTQLSPQDAFTTALAHLEQSESEWIVAQSKEVIISTYFSSMRNLLLSGLRACDGSSEKQELQRRLYRLETFRCIVHAEDPGQTESDEESTFDGAIFAAFCEASVLDLARQLAKEGRISALSVLIERNGWNLLPHRLQLLELLPPAISPREYAHLLPAILPDTDATFATLQVDSAVTSVVPATLYDDNVQFDLTVEERAVFIEAAQDTARQTRMLARWLSDRILKLDAHFGHLSYANELCQLATQCVALPVQIENEEDAIAASLYDLSHHAQRLHAWIYPSDSVDASEDTDSMESWALEEWMNFPVAMQMHHVLGELPLLSLLTPVETNHVMERVGARLERVFVSTRSSLSLHVLDVAFADLCATVMNESRGANLCVGALVLYRSNPLRPMTDRWIQDDSLLLQTALNLAYYVSPSTTTQETSELPQQGMLEHLWTIFQSLPVRTDDDPPHIAQLQVQADALEDILISMDVLAKYSIATTPTILSQPTEHLGYDFVQKMARAALNGHRTNPEAIPDAMEWRAVWVDVMQLKQRIFGERVSLDAMLEILLGHLLQYASYASNAIDLVTTWLMTNGDAGEQVSGLLLTALELQSASVNSGDVSMLQFILEHTLELPALQRQPDVHARVVHRLEESTQYAQACELVALLSEGNICLAPSDLQQGIYQSQKQRLDLIERLLREYPHQYRTSMQTQAWIQAHDSESSSNSSDLMGGVLHLVELMKLDERYVKQLWIQGAYAALSCASFSDACDLAGHAIQHVQELDETDDSGARQQHQMVVTNVLSLVLDLVSSGAFHSFTKKAKLCRLVLCANSSSIFAHPITDVLLSWLQKLDAMQALSKELGLSDHDLAMRQQSAAKTSADRRTVALERVLLNELKLVVEVLEQETTDRAFVLRLLQQGMQLVMAMQTKSRPDDLDQSKATFDVAMNAAEEDDCAWLQHTLQQVTIICVQDALRSVNDADDSEAEWTRLLNMGLGYVLLWTEMSSDIHATRTFWEQSLLSFLEEAAASPTSTHQSKIVKQVHQFLNDQVNSTSMRKQPDFELENEVDNYVETNADTTGSNEELNSMYRGLAAKCHALLVSQQQSQDVEAMNAFFNSEFDAQAFAEQPEYRTEMILRLAGTNKASLQLARQFAIKYEMDEYMCLLTYMTSVLTLAPDALSKLGAAKRHEQLEHAFLTESGEDLLELALHRPITFGNFLLSDADTNIYACLSGTDHVGILLVLRMILECSKRVAAMKQDDVSASSASSYLPLSKTASDRVTLMFMCLKRLKDIDTRLDFKLVCGCTSTWELLTPPSSWTDQSLVHTSRCNAVASIRPLLSAETIKISAKIMQKVHSVNLTSPLVMIYLNDLLGQYQGADGRSAFEACRAFLPVLSTDHLLLFHNRFVGIGSTDEEQDTQSFYGQELHLLSEISDAVDKETLMQVTATTRSIVQARMSTQSSEELVALDDQLVKSAILFTVEHGKPQGWFAAKSSQWIDWKRSLNEWLLLSPEDREDQVNQLLIELCVQVTCIDYAVLLMKLILSATPSTINQDITRIVRSVYQEASVNLVHRYLELDQTDSWMTSVVGQWIMTGADNALVFSSTAPPLQALEDWLSCIGQREEMTGFDKAIETLKQIASPQVQTAIVDTAQDEGGLENAVVSSWTDIIQQCELEGQWMATAIISHVIKNHDEMFQKTRFGYLVKAICAWLSAQNEFIAGVFEPVFQLPTDRVVDDVDSIFTVFKQLLVEEIDSRGNALQKMVTLSLALLVREIDALMPFPIHNDTVRWDEEQKQAIQRRVRSQFMLADDQGFEDLAPENVTNKTESQADIWWATLLCHGQWSNTHALLQWYLQVAYTKIWRPEAIEAFVAPRWDQEIALHILLVCPFDELRSANEVRLLSALRERIVKGPRDNVRDQLLELSLLRFDLSVLQQTGLYAQIVVHAQSPSQTARYWTSSGDYLVCALVLGNQFAAAGRLACALWHVHRLLWDLENAQLHLTNYLKALVRSAGVSAHEQQVHELTLRHFTSRQWT